LDEVDGWMLLILIFKIMNLMLRVDKEEDGGWVM